MSLSLRTTSAVYEDAARRMDKGRGKTITVPRQMFNDLLIDHARLSAFALKWGEDIKEEKT